MIDAKINNIDLLIIPLNKNKIDGIIDSANALKMLSFLKQIIHIKQYKVTRTISPAMYIMNALSFHHPKQVLGIFININPKQLNLPI